MAILHVFDDKDLLLSQLFDIFILFNVGTTKSVRTTAAPTPISAGTTLPTNHMNTVPTIKPFISNGVYIDFFNKLI